MAECSICDKHLSERKAGDGEYSCMWCGEVICDDCMEDHEEECAAENDRKLAELEKLAHDQAETLKQRNAEREKCDQVQAELNSIFGF